MREGLYRVQRHSVLVYRHQRHKLFYAGMQTPNTLYTDRHQDNASVDCHTHDYPCFRLRFVVYLTAKDSISNDDKDMMIGE